MIIFISSGNLSSKIEIYLVYFRFVDGLQQWVDNNNDRMTMTKQSQKRNKKKM